MRLSIKVILIFFATILCSVNMLAQSDRQFIRKGNQLFTQQKYDKAEIEYRKALFKNAQNPQALYNLGCALASQHKDSLAMIQYTNASKVETSNIRKAKVYHNMGVIIQKQKKYDEAIKYYEESLRNNPNDNETRYNLVLCKKLLKNNKNKDNKNKQNKNKQNKNKKDKQQNKDKQNNKQDKNKQNNRNKQQQPNNMNKDNAEQLLNAAMQNEQATQKRLRQAMKQQGKRQLQQNW